LALYGAVKLQKDVAIVPTESIEKSILLVRYHKVMLDADLAALYGVETKQLVRAVKRNIFRFPNDFMFQLSKDEFENLRYHFGTSSQWGGRRYPPYAFTEQGVAMLSSILKSKRAVQVNIEIMRAFVRLRRILASHADLARKLEALEKKYDAQFKVVFDVISKLMAPPEPESPKKRIGFLVEEPHVPYKSSKGLKKQRSR
jgi:phage regulator Rha-like protein